MQSTSQTNRRFSRRIWILMGVMVLLAAGVILVVQLLGGGGSGTLIGKWQSAEGDLLQLNEDGTYAFVGKAVYEVVAGDNLWRIAERKLGSGTHYTDIRELNGLTSNAIRVGMKLLIP